MSIEKKHPIPDDSETADLGSPADAEQDEQKPEKVKRKENAKKPRAPVAPQSPSG
jgi:hypothetical protein